MSEIRDYGLDGATQSQLDTSQSPMPPPPIDLEAQSPQSPDPSQETDNKRPTSPIVSPLSQAIPSGVASRSYLSDMLQKSSDFRDMFHGTVLLLEKIC